jgi:hypothetical protein
MQTREGQGHVERGIMTARAGQRMAGRAQLERARQAGSEDPVLLMWLAWTARTPEMAVDHLRTLQQNPEFEDVATAGLCWLEGLTGGTTITH